MADLQLVGLAKHYGPTIALDGVSITVADREFVTLLGPSGSGKTTALRIVAGFIEPTDGTVFIGGRDVTWLPPERRDIGMVFQSYALFPHMTVWKNIAFGLERRRIPRADRDRQVGEALDLVRLTGLGGRYPRELSGGQQQRVALARALAIRPTLLLLDEPLSNLDAKLRGEVRLEIRRLQRDLGITTVLVTHDQEEALTVSDRIAVMREGRIEQIAAPGALYTAPANRFVAEFVGRMNFLPVTRVEGGDNSFASYRLPDGQILRAPITGDTPSEGTLAIRPEALRCGPPPDTNSNNLTATLEYRVFLGEITEVGARLPDNTAVVIRTLDPSGIPTDPGAPISLWWNPGDGRLLAK